MILLEPEDFHKAIEQLDKVDYNCYFAKSVLQKHVMGNVYVDNVKNPTVFYIVHPYGMSLLLGDYTNTLFINNFQNYCLNTDYKRKHVDWLQVFPIEWCDVIEKIGNSTEKIIESYKRINFKFNPDIYQSVRKTIDLDAYHLEETNATVFESMPGTVVPLYFWDNATDFVTNSKSFSLFVDGQPVSTAFASFLIDDILEIGIQTADGYQRNGYSALTSCRLIDYCIEKGLEPLWSCKNDNVGSIKLAYKLGFEVARTGPYYKINCYEMQ